ncbi:MAG: heme o synthase [Gaiella sp.]
MAAEPQALAAGLFLRLTALGGAAAAGAVVVSAASGLDAGHWGAALLGLAFQLALVLGAWYAYPHLRAGAFVALGLLASAIATGGLVALSGDARWAVVLHVGAAAATLAGCLYVAGASLRGVTVAAGPWRDYVTLTKPRVMSLLLLTGVAGMFVGAGGTPPAVDVIALTVGLALACGGAAAFNHVLDADIDRLMGERTADRPVAAGRVLAPRAIEFGLALSALSFVILTAANNVLTALLALGGNFFYVVVYTRWLKRSTDQNIVIGGIAGAVPPLVGYAAGSGSLGWPALWLFLIVFLWTPPHFWALALMIKEHYANAKVPMLPVSRGDAATRTQILVYSVAMVLFTLAVGLALGPVYTLGALLLGLVFLVMAWQLRRDGTRRRAAVLFHYSLLYLALLFVVAGLDPLLT